MSTYLTTQGAGTSGLAFDLTKGQPIVSLPISPAEAIATMPVQQLLQVVPDPRKAENTREVAQDPTLAAYQAIREEVQRAVQGAKARNAIAYGRYLVDGLRAERPWIAPAITLYHPLPLEEVPIGNGQVALLLPFGDFLVAIDGETQRIAWQLAAQDYPPALAHRVKVVIHHGVDDQWARQGFYDLNTREVKPNAAVAISMDTMDIGTRVTRRVMDESEILQAGGVNLVRRQLRGTDPELLTISALRTGIVTAILGAPGLQVGSRPIDPNHPLLQDVDLVAMGDAVVEVWSKILEQLKPELEPAKRARSVVSAPAVMAGLGVLANHAIPKPPRRQEVEPWSVEQVVDHLRGVNWGRIDAEGRSPWDGVAGKFTPKGAFSLGGPKEVGHTVAAALEHPSSDAGRQIRK
jgi:DNA sulfur modification protein DndB